MFSLLCDSLFKGGVDQHSAVDQGFLYVTGDIESAAYNRLHSCRRYSSLVLHDELNRNLLDLSLQCYCWYVMVKAAYKVED